MERGPLDESGGGLYERRGFARVPRASRGERSGPACVPSVIAGVKSAFASEQRVFARVWSHPGALRTRSSGPGRPSDAQGRREHVERSTPRAEGRCSHDAGRPSHEERSGADGEGSASEAGEGVSLAGEDGCLACEGAPERSCPTSTQEGSWQEPAMGDNGRLARVARGWWCRTRAATALGLRV